MIWAKSTRVNPPTPPDGPFFLEDTSTRRKQTNTSFVGESACSIFLTCDPVSTLNNPTICRFHGFQKRSTCPLFTVLNGNLSLSSPVFLKSSKHPGGKSGGGARGGCTEALAWPTKLDALFQAFGFLSRWVQGQIRMIHKSSSTTFFFLEGDKFHSSPPRDAKIHWKFTNNNSWMDSNLLMDNMTGGCENKGGLPPSTFNMSKVHFQVSSSHTFQENTVVDTPPKTNMTMEKQQAFKDVSPMTNVFCHVSLQEGKSMSWSFMFRSPCLLLHLSATWPTETPWGSASVSFGVLRVVPEESKKNSEPS